nr:MAG TPA: hypothetical protein [Caudoviricetes sp.]
MHNKKNEAQQDYLPMLRKHYLQILCILHLLLK